MGCDDLIGYNRRNINDPYDEQPKTSQHAGMMINIILVLAIFLLLLLTI